MLLPASVAWSTLSCTNRIKSYTAMPWERPTNTYNVDKPHTCRVKEARHEKGHISQFHWHEAKKRTKLVVCDVRCQERNYPCRETVDNQKGA